MWEMNYKYLQDVNSFNDFQDRRRTIEMIESCGSEQDREKLKEYLDSRQTVMERVKSGYYYKVTNCPLTYEEIDYWIKHRKQIEYFYNFQYNLFWVIPLMGICLFTKGNWMYELVFIWWMWWGTRKQEKAVAFAKWKMTLRNKINNDVRYHNVTDWDKIPDWKNIY